MVEDIRKYRGRIVLLVLLAIILMPALSNLRLLARSEWSFQLFLDTIVKQNILISILNEAGSSIEPLLNIMYSTQFSTMRLYGLSYIITFLYSIMPSGILDVFGIDKSIAQLQIMYTLAVNPQIARMGGGLGFSIFAEAFLNFEWFGLIFFLFFGFLYVWAIKKSLLMIKKGNYILLPLVMQLCQRVLIYSRSDIYDFYGNIKLTLYIYIALAFWVFYLRTKNRNEKFYQIKTE